MGLIPQLGIDTACPIFSSTVAATGTTFAMPAKATVITVQSLATANPSALSYLIEASMDALNFVALGVAITATTGALTTYTCLAPFVRARPTTITGATGFQIIAVAKQG